MPDSSQQPRQPISAYEALTAQFYAWESRGRGWLLSGFPVALEPPFRPFFGHFIAPRPAADDGRRSTFLGALAAKLRGDTPKPAPVPYWEGDEPEPEAFAYAEPLAEIQVALPREAKPSRERAAQLLCRLASGSDPVTFELIAQGGLVTLQFACPETDREQMREQILAHYPDAAVRKRQDSLADRWREAPPAVALADFGLSREFMLPLRIPRDTDVDPLVSICAALRGTRGDELAVLQVIFRQAVHPWPQSIMRAVTGTDGGAFFADAPEITSRAEEKVSKPLVAAVIRVAVRAATSSRVGYRPERRRGTRPSLGPARQRAHAARKRRLPGPAPCGRLPRAARAAPACSSTRKRSRPSSTCRPPRSVLIRHRGILPTSPTPPGPGTFTSPASPDTARAPRCTGWRCATSSGTGRRGARP